MEKNRVFTYKIEESVYNVKILINKEKSTMMQVFISHMVAYSPMAIDTFLESYDLNGKLVLPFCTSGGSGIEESMPDIRGLGQRRGASVGNRLTANSLNRDMVTEWLRENGVF